MVKCGRWESRADSETIEIFEGDRRAKFDFYAKTQSGEKDVKGYRKPNVGMWREMLSRREGASTTLTSTFYVGDAANVLKTIPTRAASPKPRWEFFVPEQLFEGGSFRRVSRKAATMKKR